MPLSFLCCLCLAKYAIIKSCSSLALLRPLYCDGDLGLVAVMVVVRAELARRRCEVPAKALFRSDYICIQFYTRACFDVVEGMELALECTYIYFKAPVG